MSELAAPQVITIDGPSGTGKGTLCAMLAEYLGWHQLDSGVIYRVLAWDALCNQLSLENTSQLINTALTLDFHVGKQNQIFWKKQNVTRQIRREECGQLASQISAIEAVRAALLERQRAFLKPPGLVTDGRDMGTVVFPQAFLKFFLTADETERARRRFEQLKKQGICVSLAQVLNELTLRDKRDQSRAFSPLKAADEAILIDTTLLSVFEVFELMLREIKQRGITIGEGSDLPSKIDN